MSRNVLSDNIVHSLTVAIAGNSPACCEGTQGTLSAPVV